MKSGWLQVAKLRKWNVMVCTQGLWIYNVKRNNQIWKAALQSTYKPFFSQFFSQAFITYKVPWVSLVRKVQHYDMEKKNEPLSRKSMCCKHILIHYIINWFFSYCGKKRYRKKLLGLKIIFVKEVNWNCDEVQLLEMVGRCVSLLLWILHPPLFQSSKKFKNDQWTRQALTYTGLPPYAQSVSGAIRQRGSILFWKKYERLKKKQKQTKTGFSSLQSCLRAFGDPVLSMSLNARPCTRLLRVNPGAYTGAGGSSVRVEGRTEASLREEEADQQTPKPLLSTNHQRRCWWRFRLRTERTSAVNLSASSIGSKFRSAVSLGSLNHDLIGIALSGWLR